MEQMSGESFLAVRCMQLHVIGCFAMFMEKYSSTIRNDLREILVAIQQHQTITTLIQRHRHVAISMVAIDTNKLIQLPHRPCSLGDVISDVIGDGLIARHVVIDNAAYVVGGDPRRLT